MSAPACIVDARRDHVRAHRLLTGLDWVDVDESQTQLSVRFLGRAPEGLTRDTVRIDGGRSERDRVSVRQIELFPSDDERLDDIAVLHVDKPGDYSSYTIRLFGLDGIDPRYASLDFSFKANCPGDLDCRPACPPPPQAPPSLGIDYLAKDYGGFRQLILDRLTLVCPDWEERHVPDIGIALVELLAYAGDYLSYYQDAVATEAYLETARRRTSVRRHARLVDYRLGEGCNARALVAVEVAAEIELDPARFYFTTQLTGFTDEAAARSEAALERLAAGSFEGFEPLGTAPVLLRPAHNDIRFHDWGGRECCLPVGSTRATLVGRLADDDREASKGDAKDCGEDGEGKPQGNDAPVIALAPGDILVLEELIGPRTGAKADADPSHRQAVRLTAVRGARDELLDIDLVEIAWHADDALRFELCLSALGPAPDCRLLDPVSVAHGNIVAVDHGLRAPPDDLGRVPVVDLPQCCDCEGKAAPPATAPGRYRPALAHAPLTFAAPWDEGDSAAALLAPDPARAMPAIRVAGEDGSDWQPAFDLLSAGADDRRFVVETEEEDPAWLRFGDGLLGAQPRGGVGYTAHYRTGTGVAGNVGAEAIALLVHRDSNLAADVVRVRNAIAAAGGARRETLAEARLMAPVAFRFGPQALKRAIVAEDYASIAQRDRRVHSAAARLRWTGSWYAPDVGLDLRAVAEADAADALADGTALLEGVRRIGHDLAIRRAEAVPIDLAIHVCVAAGYRAAHVKAVLLDLFGDASGSDGTPGLFHPDRLTCGSPIRLSALVAAAHGVEGVASVHVTRLQRQFAPAAGEIAEGLLRLRPWEVAQLANDPNHPDRGRIEINVEGGC